jgi:hypothetical protein
MRNNLLLLVTLGLLGACTHVPVKVLAAQPPITRFAIEFTPAAQKQMTADERFNTEALRNAISTELGSRHLLNLQLTGTGRVAVIQVDEFSVRATSNLVLLGHLRSAGVLAAVVRIREATGESREFHVRADVSMNISKADTAKNPLKKLYGGFATQLADELTGTVTTPQRQHP